ncbi:MAG: protein BatD [Bacteroidales bacterium]|nr:protein BatD [Bacteroidales bacterium]
MYKLFFSFTLLIIATTATVAQDVKVTLTAPSKVSVGQPFNIEVSVNDQNARLGTPKFEGLGMRGKMQNFSAIYDNGVKSEKVSVIYTVIAPKAGKYTIPAVEASLSGNIYKSNSVTIEAVDDGNSTSNGGNGNNSANTGGNVTSSHNEDIFIELMPSKSEVYVGEQIIVSADLYSRYYIRKFTDALFPNSPGFWSKVLKSPSNFTETKKKLNNRTYIYFQLEKKALFPQKVGSLTLEPYTISCIIPDAFGFATKYPITGKPKTIKVKPLPTEGKPEGFGGAVGNFTISISADKAELKLDEPLTIKVTVSGSGNFPLFETPKLVLPSAFEQFDPKSAENITSTSEYAGSKTFSTVAIARQSGEFTIPPIEFHYFDPKSKSYKTTSSKELKLTVIGERVENNNTASTLVSKTDVEDLGNDIRFIKQSGVSFSDGNSKFFNSFKFWMIFALIITLFGITLIVRQQQIKNNANVIGMKNRLAGKTSRKRLKLAATYIEQNKKDEFYAETLNALWGYLSDKLAIPRADLSRDNVQEKFAEKQIDSSVTQKFIDVLDTCEFEHYAPESAAHPLSEVYTMAAEAIEQMESSFKA